MGQVEFNAALAAATSGTVIDLGGGTVPYAHIQSAGTFDPPIIIRNGTANLVRVTNTDGVIFDNVNMIYTANPADIVTFSPFFFLGCDNVTVRNCVVRGSRSSGTLPNGRVVENEWWGAGLQYRNCNNVTTVDTDVRNLWQGIYHLDTNNTVVRRCRVQDHGDDAVRCYGGSGHLIEDSLLLDADPPPVDDPLAFHPDAIHCSIGTSTQLYAQDVTIRRNWLSSTPTVEDAADSNTIIIQSTSDIFASNMVIEDNVLIAGGGSAIIIERPQDCIVRRNTIIDRDNFGAVPKISLRDRGETDLNTISDDNVVPSSAFQASGTGIVVTNQAIVPYAEYAENLVMTGPIETWRAVPGGSLDGVGCYLIWPSNP